MGAASAALMLAVATPAFASFVETNTANVNNSSNAAAYSGSVSLSSNASASCGEVSNAFNSNDVTLISGDAKAKSLAVSVSNVKVGCVTCNDAVFETNTANVNNASGAAAGSGAVGLSANASTVLGKVTNVGNGNLVGMRSGGAKTKSAAFTVQNVKIGGISL